MYPIQYIYVNFSIVFACCTYYTCKDMVFDMLKETYSYSFFCLSLDICLIRIFDDLSVQLIVSSTTHP